MLTVLNWFTGAEDLDLHVSSVDGSCALTPKDAGPYISCDDSGGDTVEFISLDHENFGQSGSEAYKWQGLGTGGASDKFMIFVKTSNA